MAVSLSDNLAKEICDALGLKHVRKLDLHFEAGGVATVEAEIYPEVDGVKQIPTILKKFQLSPAVEEVTAIGDEYKSYTYDLTFDALVINAVTKALRNNKLSKTLKALLK